MSDPRLDYALRMLRLDPRRDIDAIIASRRSFVGLSAEAPASTEADESERDEAETTLKTLRHAFWSLEPAEIRRRLASCRTAPFPDLARSATRIESVNDLRDQFAAIREHPQIHDAFASTLERFVLASPRERVGLAGEIERQAVRRGHDVWRRSARHVKKRFPDVAALVPAWLDDVEKRRRERGFWRTLFRYWWWILLGLFLLQFVLGMILDSISRP